MPSAILDSSALLAFINDEPGGKEVDSILADAAISAVNHAEVVSKLVARGVSLAHALDTLKFARVTVIEFDKAQAEVAGGLIMLTKKYGLSLGDRACLALAARESAPALTTDKVWEKIGQSAGVAVRVIR